jgi:AraC family transcriptional regulator
MNALQAAALSRGSGPSSSDRIVMASTGRAWMNLHTELISPQLVEKGRIFPPNEEPQIVGILSGSAVVEERELGGSWQRTETVAGDFFLTAMGPSYEVRWEATAQPYKIIYLCLGLPFYTAAMREVFGSDSKAVQLRDVSGFKDPFLTSLAEKLLLELSLGHRASSLLVQGVAQALAVHLARNYTTLSGPLKDQMKGSGLPGLTLRKIVDLMTRHFEDEFSLQRLADEAGMSEFHFSRLFKRTTGRSPSQYFISLKMEKAQTLLQKTRKSVIEIALDLGYTSPSHFAHVFRRETGLSPAAFRRQV